MIVAYQASLSTAADYKRLMDNFGEAFEAGFAEWGRAVAAAGWGHFELLSFDREARTAVVRVTNPWELQMLEPESLTGAGAHGCPFLLGKIIGLFTHALGTNCWADEREVRVGAQTSSVEFHLYPHVLTIEQELAALRSQKHAEHEHRLARELEGRILESIQAEQTLRESEERYRNLFENKGLAVVVFDADTMCVEDANQAALELYGYSMAELEALPALGLSAEKQKTQAVFDRMRAGGAVDVRVAQRKQRRKDGSIFEAEIFGGSFNVRGRQKLFGLIQDVTDRVHAARRERETTAKTIALREVLQLLNRAPTVEAAYDAAVQGVLMMLDSDRASVLLFGEDGKVHFSAWHGLSEGYRQAVDGHCPWQQTETSAEPIFMDDIRVADLPEPLRETILGEGILASAFFPMNAGDRLLGKYMAYYDAPHAFTEEECAFGKILAGELVAALSRLERVRLLNLSERRLALAMEGTSDGLWDWNVQTGEVYFSPRWAEMLGYDAGELEPDVSTWERIIHPDDLAAIERYREDHFGGRSPSYQAEHQARTKDGSWIRVLDRGKIVERDPEGKPLRAVGTYTDISERKRAEGERTAMQRRVEHAQRLESLGVLAGGIAHDFNNILTVIMGNASLAESKDVTSIGEVREHLANIVKSSETAAQLCRQMLTYAGKGQLVVELLELSSVVAEVTALLRVSINRSVELHYNFAGELPLIAGDKSQLQQVVMNMVINASDSIGEEPGVVALSTGVMDADASYLAGAAVGKGLPAGRYVYLQVADSGCGMGEETMALIFEPFFTTKFTGRGLGMSAVLGIVRGHKGAIKVCSEQGKGTTLRLLFPVIEGEGGARVSLPEQADTLWRATGTVLVVDDEPAVLSTAIMMLSRLGFETLTASDGQDGIDVFRQHQHEIVAVLLDMTMPGLDGAACFRELRRIDADVAIVLMSGYSEREVTRGFAGQGLAGFIQKPFLPAALAEVMRLAIR